MNLTIQIRGERIEFQNGDGRRWMLVFAPLLAAMREQAEFMAAHRGDAGVAVEADSDGN